MYKEKQGFNPAWFLIIVSTILGVSYFFNSLNEGDYINFLPILFKNAFFIILFYLIFINAKLITEINQEYVKAYWILAKYIVIEKKIPLDAIKKAEIIKYSFVGYGYRLTLKYGKVFNARGNKGLLLQLNNGKKFLIGTNKEKELLNCIKSLKISEHEK